MKKGGNRIVLQAGEGSRMFNLGDCDDLMQESFIRTLRSQAAQPIANVRGLLFTTARNLAGGIPVGGPGETATLNV